MGVKTSGQDSVESGDLNEKLGGSSGLIETSRAGPGYESTKSSLLVFSHLASLPGRAGRGTRHSDLTRDLTSF